MTPKYVPFSPLQKTFAGPKSKMVTHILEHPGLLVLQVPPVQAMPFPSEISFCIYKTGIEIVASRIQHEKSMK